MHLHSLNARHTSDVGHSGDGSIRSALEDAKSCRTADALVRRVGQISRHRCRADRETTLTQDCIERRKSTVLAESRLDDCLGECCVQCRLHRRRCLIGGDLESVNFIVPVQRRH